MPGIKHRDFIIYLESRPCITEMILISMDFNTVFIKERNIIGDAMFRFLTVCFASMQLIWNYVYGFMQTH